MRTSLKMRTKTQSHPYITFNLNHTINIIKFYYTIYNTYIILYYIHPNPTSTGPIIMLFQLLSRIYMFMCSSCYLPSVFDFLLSSPFFCLTSCSTTPSNYLPLQDLIISSSGQLYYHHMCITPHSN